VLDALGVERAVLAGASMGAHTILWLALRAPERVGGLVVITPGYDPEAQEDPARLGRWDSLADGLERGGVEGFLAVQGEREVPERWRETVETVTRQRLSLHEHPEAVAQALRVVPRSRPFGGFSELGPSTRRLWLWRRTIRRIPDILRRWGRPTRRRFPKPACSPTNRAPRRWRGRGASCPG
jgi:pimeloyl-ACP methyl ester carboxylesterase